MSNTLDIDELLLAQLAGDEGYWDHLDMLEVAAGGTRELDNLTEGGAS